MESRDSVRTVAVIGLGTMGTGIAEVVARHGFAVRAIDIDDTTVVDVDALEHADLGDRPMDFGVVNGCECRVDGVGVRVSGHAPMVLAD